MCLSVTKHPFTVSLYLWQAGDPLPYINSPFQRPASLSLKWLSVSTASIYCELFSIREGFCCGEGRGQTASHHCKLSSLVAAEDWRWAACCSWWTSLTAEMRVSMLCRMVRSNGWQVYQWELWRSEMEMEKKKLGKITLLKLISFNIKKKLCMLAASEEEGDVSTSQIWKMLRLWRGSATASLFNLFFL